MLPLEPMGVGLRIEPEVGPIIDRPIRSAADVAALRPFDPAEVSFTLDAIRLVRRELDGKAGVIGFSGAPFTLACYLIEGRPSRDFAIAKAFMYREPEAWHDLMERLSAMVAVYLRAQVDAGAEVVQLFDSWVGGLGPADYATFVQPHVRRIFAALDGTCRRSISGPGRRPCSSSWPRPAATSSASTIASRWPTPGDGSVTTEGHPGQPRRRPAAGRLGGDARRARKPFSTRRPGGRATSSTSATACCPRPTRTCLRRLVDFVHEQTARTAAAAEVLA